MTIKGIGLITWQSGEFDAAGALVSKPINSETYVADV